MPCSKPNNEALALLVDLFRMISLEFERSRVNLRNDGERDGGGETRRKHKEDVIEIK